jgi:hypothetical protein
VANARDRQHIHSLGARFDQGLRRCANGAAGRIHIVHKQDRCAEDQSRPRRLESFRDRSRAVACVHAGAMPFGFLYPNQRLIVEPQTESSRDQSGDYRRLVESALPFSKAMQRDRDHNIAL